MWSKPYNTQIAQYTASKGYHAALSMFASGKARFMSNTNDVYDASASGECGATINHFVNFIGYEGNRVINMFNSFGTSWGNQGGKRIRTCSDTAFWGATGSRITYLE